MQHTEQQEKRRMCIFDICMRPAVFYTGFDVNVMDLYHGPTCPLDQICAEGLDPRISVHGHFGRGIYFRFDADDFHCSVQ